MNMDQNQFEPFEKSLADSLEAISRSAPAAPQAEQIFHQLRRRKRRRIHGAVTAVVLLVGGISLFTFLPSNRQVSLTPLAGQPPMTIDVSAKTQTYQPWKIPTMKLIAVSPPTIQVQDHLTADIPASSIPAEAARVSPNISLRFVAPRVSLPHL